MIGKRYTFGISFFLACSLGSLFGQDLPDSGSIPHQVPDGGEEKRPDSDLMESDEADSGLSSGETGQSLYDKTLKKDIDTASYYELVAWVKSLGLNDRGSIDSLRTVLYDYYAVTAGSDKTGISSGSVITIKSAFDTDYFTIEGPDQQMIRLKGNVLVEMEESERSRRHIIQADEIIFNQTDNTLTATGNLEYRMISGEYEDIFYGDSLTFSLSSWNGVIFKGSSLRTETVDGDERTFYFNGEIIRKAGTGGIFILENGDVQTQDVENPDFHLKAQRLWLMGPKEWGVRHGILYMGHVPVLYIPFYYKPGNEMVFNPVIGSKLRAGNFIQTTTYLLGRKDSSENLAFFQLGDSDETNYKLVREGLYLMKENETPEEDDGNTLKVMADWYARLGYFSAIQGEFPDGPFLEDLDFFSGIGVSRTISDSYEIYFEDDDGEYRSDWNSIRWGSTDIPFRWGQTLSFSTGHLTGSFQFFSDPYFNRDFLDREESFDWLNTLLTTDEGSEDEVSLVTDMEWDLTYSNSSNTQSLTPFVESLSLDELRLRMDWNRKSNESESLEYPNDPAREFFFPESVDFPYIRAGFSGTPFSFSSLKGWGWNENSQKEKKEDQEEEDEELIPPPWTTEESEEEDAPEESRHELIEPENLWSENFSGYSREMFSTSLSYDFSTMMYINGETAHEEWDSPDDTEFIMDKTLFLTNNSFVSDFENSFFDHAIDLDNTNSLQFNYRTHMDALGARTDDLAYEDFLSDYQYQSLKWNNNLNADLSPFSGVNSFSSSGVSYQLNNLLYQKALESYEEGDDPVYSEEWAEWNEEKVSSHFIKAHITYSPDSFYATSSVSYYLPPLDRKDLYTNTLGWNSDLWDMSLSHSISYADEDGEREWTYNPLVFSASVTPMDHLTWEQDISYSFEEETYTKSRSYLSAWGFHTEYLHEYTTPYEWDPVELEWVAGDEDFVPSSFSAGYSLEFEQPPLWKNRITWDTEISLDWSANLQQYTDNTLGFIWKYHFNIFQFLDLDYSMTSVNNNMYLYFPSLREKLGIEKEYHFFTDLGRSFNIFSPDQKERLDSFFNLESIRLDLVHHLREWDLTLVYQGWPELQDKQYEWKSEVSIFLKWNPIPQIQADIQYQDEQWLVDTEKD